MLYRLSFEKSYLRMPEQSWYRMYASSMASGMSSESRKRESSTNSVFSGTEKFQNDPYWRDLIPFHEYFHGDNGAGIGASHQTGWTALVAKLIQQYGDSLSSQ